jgi:hypothetical protein
MQSPRPAVLLSVLCLATILLDAPGAAAWQSASSEPVEMSQFQPAVAPKIALRAAVYLPPETCNYRFHYMLAAYSPVACSRIMEQLQAAFNDVVKIDQLAGTHQDVDIVISVQQPAGKLWQSGLVHGSSSLSLNFAAVSATAAPILQDTEVSSMKGVGGHDIKSSFAELSADVCGRFLQKLKATEFIQAALRPPPPKPVAPAAPQPAVLEISSSASVQVYIDDEFKGTTSVDGHLVVTLPAGPHRLRLSEPGKKEWVQPIALLAGQRLPLSAQLESAGPKPLTEQEVEDALTNGVPKPRVKKLVADYGVAFALSDEIERRLRAAGADDELLLAIVKNRK